MRAEEYLKDPCRVSSLPFWKTEQLILPRGVTVIRDDLYIAERNGGTEEPYFKLVHRLETLCPPKLPDSFRIVPCEPEGFARHIRECYAEEGVNADELRACARRPDYDPELWIAVEDETNGRIAASGIADLDARIGEELSAIRSGDSLPDEKTVYVFLSGKKDKSLPLYYYKLNGYTVGVADRL